MPIKSVSDCLNNRKAALWNWQIEAGVSIRKSCCFSSIVPHVRAEGLKTEYSISIRGMCEVSHVSAQPVAYVCRHRSTL